jgi:hypothetical protein
VTKGHSEVNKWKLQPALTQFDVRDLVDAEHFAERIGKKLNTTVTIHPKLLDEYPVDAGGWLSSLFNKLRIRGQRAGFGYSAIWVRESFKSLQREHVRSHERATQTPE